VSSLGDDDFSWDSAIDGATDASTSSWDSDASDDMYANDPWRATCVVGLRVCSLDDGVKIEVDRGQGKGSRKDIGVETPSSPA
jgi:hypothetical protein